jgi:3-methyladenine DNA glycosylase/8-oxoguanine DNA glycosylase
LLNYDPVETVAHLRAADPVLAHVIEAVGPFELETREGRSECSRAIFFQQPAGPAARAIMNRVLALMDADEERWYAPERLLAASDEQLRAAGVSRQKMVYLRDLADKFASEN